MRRVFCDVCKEDIGTTPSDQTILIEWVDVLDFVALVRVDVFTDRNAAHYPDLCKTHQAEALDQARRALTGETR